MMPSLKYSSSLLSLRFLKGRTAMALPLAPAMPILAVPIIWNDRPAARRRKRVWNDSSRAPNFCGPSPPWYHAKTSALPMPQVSTLTRTVRMASGRL